MCLLDYRITWILTSTTVIIECISWLIKVTVKLSVSEFRVLDCCLREGTYSVLDPYLDLVERLLCCLLTFKIFFLCNFM
jgi:hypothetical protein